MSLFGFPIVFSYTYNQIILFQLQCWMCATMIHIFMLNCLIFCGQVCSLFDVKFVCLLSFLLLYICACCWAVLFIFVAVLQVVFCDVCYVCCLKNNREWALVDQAMIDILSSTEGKMRLVGADTPSLLWPPCYTFRETLTLLWCWCNLIPRQSCTLPGICVF